MLPPAYLLCNTVTRLGYVVLACSLMDGASASLVHLQARLPRSSYTHVNIKSADAQLVGAHAYVLLPSHNSCCDSSAAPAHCCCQPSHTSVRPVSCPPPLIGTAFDQKTMSRTNHAAIWAPGNRAQEPSM